MLSDSSKQVAHQGGDQYRVVGTPDQLIARSGVVLASDPRLEGPRSEGDTVHATRSSSDRHRPRVHSSRSRGLSWVVTPRCIALLLVDDSEATVQPSGTSHTGFNPDGYEAEMTAMEKVFGLIHTSGASESDTSTADTTGAATAAPTAAAGQASVATAAPTAAAGHASATTAAPIAARI